MSQRPAAATAAPVLEKFYALAEHRYGPTGWWPADTPFEIAVGAILVQNTAWRNVEKAIQNLKNARALDPNIISALPHADLEYLIQPSGFFRVKARRLRSFCAYLLERHGGSMQRLAR